MSLASVDTLASWMVFLASMSSLEEEISARASVAASCVFA